MHARAASRAKAQARRFPDTVPPSPSTPHRLFGDLTGPSTRASLAPLQPIGPEGPATAAPPSAAAAAAAAEPLGRASAAGAEVPGGEAALALLFREEPGQRHELAAALAGGSRFKRVRLARKKIQYNINMFSFNMPGTGQPPTHTQPWASTRARARDASSLATLSGRDSEGGRA
jgi:hypothetical protein